MRFWISRSSRFGESLVIDHATGNFVVVRVRAGHNSVLGAGRRVKPQRPMLSAGRGNFLSSVVCAGHNDCRSFS